MRNMSFAFTVEQIRHRTKTVTRRFGWRFLNPGDLVQPVEKGMGLKRGEKVKRIGPPIRIVSITRQQLSAMTYPECVLEGFPDMDHNAFVEMFCRHNCCDRRCTVNRIEFEYLPESEK